MNLTFRSAVSGAIGATRTIEAFVSTCVVGCAVTRTLTIVSDSAAPTLTAPRLTLPVNRTIGGSIPAVLTWTGSDAGTGVKSYHVQRSVNAGAWTTVVAAVAVPRLDVALASGSSYRFRVRATDWAGRTSGFAYGPTLRSARIQESSTTITYTGRWTAATWPSASGGALRFATAAGAKATYRGSVRSAAWVTTTGPDRGWAKVYVNGVLAKRVSLTTSASQPRRVVWSANWSTTATRTVVILVEGTSGKPRVDLDAIMTLR